MLIAPHHPFVTRFKKAKKRYLNRSIRKSRILEDQKELNFQLLSEKIIDKDEFKERRSRLESQLEELRQKQNAIRQRDHEIEVLRMKFDESMKSLETLDVDTMGNAELRMIVERVEVYTNPYKLKHGNAKDAKQVRIQWRFLDKTTEGGISWDHLKLEAEEWKRNVWYKGMTDEEIQEEEERLAEEAEWLKTPEGQEYLNEQEELRKEIYELEQQEIYQKK